MKTISRGPGQQPREQIRARGRAGTVDAPRLGRRGPTRADERPAHRAKHGRRRGHCAADDHGPGRRAPRRGGRGRATSSRSRSARAARQPARRPLGGTATAVAIALRKPVLVVPPDADPPPAFRRVLVPLEGRSRPRSRRADSSSSRAASGSTSSHCTSTTRTPFPPSPTSRNTSMPAWTREFIHRYCPWGIGDVQLETRIGRIGELVPIVAEECGCDLIALGWSQQLAPGRAPVVQETLQRSHLPVLLVPVELSHTLEGVLAAAGGHDMSPRTTPS